jgi:hypothetical protein
MTQRYTRAGKQILVDGNHMADAVDDTAAMMILNALLALDTPNRLARRMGAEFVIHGVPEATEIIEITTLGEAEPRYIRGHIGIRQGDELACWCGLRWGVDEADPH